MRTTYPDSIADHPRPLLSTNEPADFARNFREMEKYAKRRYSLMRVLRSYCQTPPKLDGFEAEVEQELKALNRTRNVVGTLVPIEALSSWRRDLTIPGLPVVQTTVADEILPFLRAKTVCGRLGATLLDGLTGGNLKLPRATVGGIASWLPEVGGGTDADQSLDSFTIIPKRITGSTVISRQLVYQSSPDIEAFVVNDLSNAIAVAVDNAGDQRHRDRTATVRNSALPGQREWVVHVRVAQRKRDIRRGGDLAKCAPVRENPGARIDPE
jgi:Phage capsid family